MMTQSSVRNRTASGRSPVPGSMQPTDQGPAGEQRATAPPSGTNGGADSTFARPPPVPDFTVLRPARPLVPRSRKRLHRTYGTRFAIRVVNDPAPFPSLPARPDGSALARPPDAGPRQHLASLASLASQSRRSPPPRARRIGARPNGLPSASSAAGSANYAARPAVMGQLIAGPPCWRCSPIIQHALPAHARP